MDGWAGVEREGAGVGSDWGYTYMPAAAHWGCSWVGVEGQGSRQPQRPPRAETTSLGLPLDCTLHVALG